MKRFFDELKQDIVERIAADSREWFPCIEAIERGERDMNRCAPDEETSIHDKINDLKNMFIIHLTGSYDQNLCYAVITAIITLEKDVRQNDRIRNRILLPLYKTMV